MIILIGIFIIAITLLVVIALSFVMPLPYILIGLIALIIWFSYIGLSPRSMPYGSSHINLVRYDKISNQILVDGGIVYSNGWRNVSFSNRCRIRRIICKDLWDDNFSESARIARHLIAEDQDLTRQRRNQALRRKLEK